MLSRRSSPTIHVLASLAAILCTGCGLVRLPIVPPPTFSPAGGAYTSTQSVTLSDTTAGATIYYTLDGSVPTAASPVYSAAIPVAASMTISAMATAPGGYASSIATATYSITPTVSTPLISPPGGAYTSAQIVTITDATPGASIFWSNKVGVAGPTSFPYTGPIPVRSNQTITAIATAPRLANSPVASATYAVTIPVTATPTFSPPAGTYTGAQTVTISDATRGALIYFTTDNTTPSSLSPVYTGPITVSQTEIVQAYAAAPGQPPSPIASALYTIAIGNGEFDWTWMGGHNINAGQYGTLGTPSPTNVPGERDLAASWTDKAGNLWLFGGLQDDTDSENDLWEFSPATTLWTWQDGSQTTNAASVYGVLGVPAAGNIPGARFQAATWTDTDGNFWLFGGRLLNYGPPHLLNDLWEYAPATGLWTWVSGSSAPDATGVYGTLGIAAAANVPGGRAGAYSWTDRSGNLWLFGGGDGLGSGGSFNDLWQFNIATRQWTWVNGSSSTLAVGVYGSMGVPSPANVPGARNDGFAWTDSSGNLWLFGGAVSLININGTGQETGYPFNDLWQFNLATRQWTWVNGSSTPDPVAVYGTMGVPTSTNVPGGRTDGFSWTDPAGNFWLFGGTQWAPAQSLQLGGPNDLWEYVVAKNQWTWVNGSMGQSNGFYGTVGVPSPANVPASEFVRGANWVDNAGRLWFFGGDDNSNDLWRYQP